MFSQTRPTGTGLSLINRVELTLPGDDKTARARFDELIKTEHWLKSSRLVGDSDTWYRSTENGWRC